MVYYTSGTAATEQDVITAIDTFLTSTIGGWVRLDTVTDTASDRDYVFFSRGETPGKYQDLYIRWRGYNNLIYVFGYSLWINSSTYSDQIHDTTYSRGNPGSGTVKYWLFGTKDWLWVLFQNAAEASYYQLFGGYIDSYYTPEQDPLPLAIIGHYTYTYYFDNNRIRMYVPMASGVSEFYTMVNDHQTTLLANGAPNARDGSVAHYPVLVTQRATASYYEVRGELPGIVHVRGDTLASEQWVTVSGTSSQFFVTKYSTTVCCMFGPQPV